MKQVVAWMLTVFALASLAIGNLPPGPKGTIKGTIKGRVLDEHGKALAGAKVTALPTGAGAFVGYMLRFVLSDRAGEFAIDKLPFGTYVVYAGKKQAGYPGTWYHAMYAAHAPPRADLTPSRPVATVTVILGPKAGMVFGDVRDARSGKPIASATFRLALHDSPSDWLQTGLATPYTLALPSRRALELRVWAPGYQPREFYTHCLPGREDSPEREARPLC
ncbi:MAG: carboxypeptidase-like regulatory domain-containing protein [Terriglobales bacterium]